MQPKAPRKHQSRHQGPMLKFLFRGLTEDQPGGRLLVDWATRVARETHWYVEGQVPDTLDGRFALLATVLGILLVRLEQDGSAGDGLSVRVTERFIEVMESEHREFGLGDPTLGKTVRKLVGMLARRTELWRQAWSGKAAWIEATRDSLYKDTGSAEALEHSAHALSLIRARLEQASLAALEEGRVR